MTELACAQNPDPVVAALETFVSAPDLLGALAAYLQNPATPASVRRLIGQIIDTADKLAAGRLVVAS